MAWMREKPATSPVPSSSYSHSTPRSSIGYLFLRRSQAHRFIFSGEMPRVFALLLLVVASVTCNSSSLVSVHTSYNVHEQQNKQQSPTTNVYLDSSVKDEPDDTQDTAHAHQKIHDVTSNFQRPVETRRQYIQHGRPLPFRRPPPPSPIRRQYGPGVFLSPPFPPAKFSRGPPKRSIPPRPISPPPKPSHLIYSKPPPEVIYYGSNPPPLDFSPPASYRTRPVGGPPSFSAGSPFPSGPPAYSSHHPPSPPFSSVQGTVPEDHDVMNDLDMYIPDDDRPGSSKSSSAMSSMMMPLMMLGLTLPALGFMLTYLGRRRRRRDVGRSDHQIQAQYLQQLTQALEKYKKRA